MSKNVAVFVDVANLYYAARGQDVDVDYVALLKHATKGRDLIRAYAYSGLDPENENQKKFLEFLGKNGYRVVAKDIRKFGDGRVKANLDIELVVDLFRLADRMDVAVIVSGDGDFAPAIRALQDQGVRCEVISFKPNTSSDLFAVADEFHDAMKLSAIGRTREAKGIGAPEMPAKEVNPDVGFREASPSVAAAALAAIRTDGGEPTRGGRGRGRGTRRPTRGAGDGEPAATAATSEPPVREASPPSDAGESEAESARRRRRRGGRGRGRRGRRGEGLETGAADAADLEPAEVTWQELDSLDELDGGATPDTDQEVTFEEADAATLAELGLTEQPSPPETVGSDASADAGATEVAPKPRSRARKSTTTRAKPPAAAKAPAMPRTSRTRATGEASAAASGKTKASTTATETTAAKAPRPRRSGGKSAKASSEATGDASLSGESSDEGIWKRLTSARATKRASAKPASED